MTGGTGSDTFTDSTGVDTFNASGDGASYIDHIWGSTGEDTVNKDTWDILH